MTTKLPKFTLRYENVIWSFLKQAIELLQDQKKRNPESNDLVIFPLKSHQITYCDNLAY